MKNKYVYYYSINIYNTNYLELGIGDWGLGIGDWGLGIGPNPQSPIPNPHYKNLEVLNCICI